MAQPAKPLPPLGRASIRIVGHDSAESGVAIDVLTKLLDSLQKTALLILAADEPVTQPKSRFKPSESLRRIGELKVLPLQAGSLIVPLVARNRARGEQLLASLAAFLGAVATGDVPGMRDVIPDSYYRQKALQEAIDCLPRPGQSWHAEFSSGEMPLVRLDHAARAVATSVVSRSQAQDDGDTEIFAELISLDFASEKVRVFHKPSNKTFLLDYPTDAEDELYQSRLTLVKVTGLFERDAAGEPVRCIRVSSIEPFDLSPISVDFVFDAERYLLLEPALTVQPIQDEESRGSVLCVTDEELGLHVYAKSRDELLREVESYLLFLWDEYAKGDPLTMDDGARKLRETLLSRVAEYPYDDEDEGS